MSHDSKLNSIIRHDRVFTTPTFVGIDNRRLVTHSVNFREADEPEELILFFRFNGMLFYSHALEFRYIENNILFIIIEYNVETFSELVTILNSSYEKEEGYRVNIKAAVYDMDQRPRFSYPLPNFQIEPEYLIQI